MFITIGAIAHVDAGKTTLCESILYKTNTISKKGRVDDSNAFLDYDPLEKQKGITIFNKEARFSLGAEKTFLYLDTPGHNELSYNLSQALNIIDVAILIIAANEEIPITTMKQFSYLLHLHIPILIFVNKMDIAYTSKEELIKQMKEKLSEACIPFFEVIETVALKEESLLEEFMDKGTIDNKAVQSSLIHNEVIPIFFGSALKDEGIDDLLTFLNDYIETNYDSSSNFEGYIYKNSDEYATLKILSGTLSNKDIFGNYQVNEMAQVNGLHRIPLVKAYAGDIVTIKGFKNIQIGTYLPTFYNDNDFHIPSSTYSIKSHLDANELYRILSPLNLQEPNLNIQLQNNNVTVALNGELHQTIFIHKVKEEYNLEILLSDPIIKYKETIENAAFGIGHFEPLRHYGEIFLKIEPSTKYCVESKINNNYIHSLLTYLNNYHPRGILTNSPLHNIKITLLKMKTHLKHTEGHDLMEATRRAIRQALTQCDSILLEPYYLTTIATISSNLNTILSELSSKDITFSIEENAIIASISIREFNSTLTSLKSRLKGNCDFTVEKTIYEPCKNSKQVIEMIGYDYTHDYSDPAGSVFCKNGSGHYVEPQEVQQYMHLDISEYLDKSVSIVQNNKIKIDEQELNRVWNSIYKPKPRYIEPKKNTETNNEYKIKPTKPLLYLIDGYNLMYKLDEELGKTDLINARLNTINLVCDFAGYVNSEVVLVFDAYLCESTKVEISKYDNITIVYTKANQTADTYIENKTRQCSKDYKVIVVTSDNLERLRVFYEDGKMITSEEFIKRYQNMQKNNAKITQNITNRPFENLKKLLQENEEE